MVRRKGEKLYAAVPEKQDDDVGSNVGRTEHYRGVESLGQADAGFL